MKISLVLATLLLMHIICISQQAEDVKLKILEYKQKDAILKGDTVLLRDVVSPIVVVQNPDNRIVSYGQIMERFKAGKLDFIAFERNIESMSFVENTAIVMGHEIVMPQKGAINAGKRVTQRFTNIWIRSGDSWKMIARQATVVHVE